MPELGGGVVGWAEQGRLPSIPYTGVSWALEVPHGGCRALKPMCQYSQAAHCSLLFPSLLFHGAAADGPCPVPSPLDGSPLWQGSHASDLGGGTAGGPGLGWGGEVTEEQNTNLPRVVFFQRPALLVPFQTKLFSALLHTFDWDFCNGN